MNHSLATLKTTAMKATAFVAPAAAALTTTAFASGDALPTIAITQDMLRPVLDGVISNIGVVLPIGLGLFAISTGIKIIPSLITRFLRM